jgi:hypothetical protein
MKTNETSGAGEVTQEKHTARRLAQACVERCQKLVAQVALVKTNLVAEFREAFGAHEKLLQLAVTEAEALAWQTDYPHLLFPALALEKVTVAADWRERQRTVRRTEPFHLLAA